MEAITANQDHVTSRPIQVRCCNQPIGLRSSLRRIQRLKKPVITTGVQKVRSVCCTQTGGGSSRQLERICRAETPIATSSTPSEIPTMRMDSPSGANVVARESRHDASPAI